MRQSRTMASQRKPVIVRRFTRDWFAAYAPPLFPAGNSDLELLDPEGKVLHVARDAVKWICYVRDFPAPSERDNPERLLHKRFTVRPRSSGLWMRLTLQDGDLLEGLAANDRTLIDGHGLLLTPPDMRSNTQRIYIPREAVQALEIVSLIGSGKRRPSLGEQPELFPGSE